MADVINRRGFLKLAGASLIGLVLPKSPKPNSDLTHLSFVCDHALSDGEITDLYEMWKRFYPGCPPRNKIIWWHGDHGVWKP